ncbi:hypothetical protein R6V09_01080 [Streptomyces sp. W16]|uniref:hypothetical protein n=1 Tax=Streptomyces sp. W16 TaxID=3076631 RepID=UPI00295BE05F|nr:hypothetical protein [Streptomyces sp. W16]MDV9168736.1 hypothetical protein [Streptomyces sp. W16]
MTSTLTTIGINRPLNPPLRVELNPAHLPADVRHAFETLAQAAADKAGADQALHTAVPADKVRLQGEADTAQTAVDAALAAYGDIGGTSTTAIHDSAASSFHKAVEATAAAIREALDRLAEAGQAAALHASTKSGRAPVRLDTNAASEAPIRGQLAMLRGYLRDTLAGLPQDIN